MKKKLNSLIAVALCALATRARRLLTRFRWQEREDGRLLGACQRYFRWS